MVAISDELALAEKALADVGVDTARTDAEWICAHVLGRRRGSLLVSPSEAFPNDDVTRFRELIARRAKREPLAYITGTVVFRGLELEVGPGSLVPRPETEITAERAIWHARQRGPRPTIVDVGTGCGAIALAIAAEVPNARIFATERAGAARGWALRNLARTGLRCTLLPGDLMSLLHPALGGGVDVVVSNPPYIADEEFASLPPEVRRFEPREALLGGSTGLDVIVELLEQVRMWLAPGGWLIIEIGETQGERVKRLLKIIGYDEVVIAKDLAGRDRVAEARWVGRW